jgi:selenide,water dikinase
MNMVEIDPQVPDYLADILFDPQTSGGLLISVPGQEADMLLQRMREEGIKEATLIGEITAGPKGKIAVK